MAMVYFFCRVSRRRCRILAFRSQLSSLAMRGMSLVEDLRGGVIVLGGDYGASDYSNSLYYLPNAGDNAQWKLLSQKLAFTGYVDISFF